MIRKHERNQRRPAYTETNHIHELKDSVLLSILPQQIYRFDAIQSKCQHDFGGEKLTSWLLKFVCKKRQKGTKIDKTIFKKNNNGRLTLFDFKIYYKAIVMSSSVILIKDYRSKEQQSPRIDFWWFSKKGTKAIHWRNK